MREMKDSGIEWIGEIPKDWCVKNGKYVFNVYGMSVNDDFINDTDEESYKIKYYKVDNLNEATEQFYIKSNFANFGIKIYEIKGPIILVPKRGGAIYTNKVRIEKEACLFDSNIMGLTTNNNVRFMAYVLYGRGLSDIGDVTTIPQINKKHIDVLKIPVPSINEQKVIVDYLDTKCSEIDATAEDIQKEIALLEDYKKSVITEAVTKGLNPDAEMKDSGVKWLPKIPKHWKVIPSKYLFANSDIRRQTGDEQLTASQKYGIITQKNYTAKENAQVVLATQGLEKWKHVEPNDFIISLRSFQGGLEMSDITGCITWHYVVLKAQKKVYHKYYKWLFKSARYINALQGTCNFIRDGQDLRFSNFALVPLFELPLEEQQQIADYLDTKCSEIDTLIADKKRQVDILADYKKSLIYEYVTGKKEVV